MHFNHEFPQPMKFFVTMIPASDEIVRNVLVFHFFPHILPVSWGQVTSGLIYSLLVFSFVFISFKS